MIKINVVQFLIGLCLSFIYSCNQNTQSNTLDEISSKKTITTISDTLKNRNINNETVLNKKAEQIKTEKSENISENINEYFTLLSAKSEIWTAGTIGGGSGIDYYFKVKINTTEIILFDSAWINNYSFKIFISKETTSISNEPVNYYKGDNIILRISDLKNQNTKIVNSIPPIKFKGSALIRYTVNSKRKYFVIKEIKKQTQLNLP